MSQKLDSFNKILLATAQINYLASNLNGVNQLLKSNTVLAESNRYTTNLVDAELEAVVFKLTKIMEKLANKSNEIDCVSPIDMRVTKDAFDILVHCKDDVEA